MIRLKSKVVRQYTKHIQCQSSSSILGKDENRPTQEKAIIGKWKDYLEEYEKKWIEEIQQDLMDSGTVLHTDTA